MAEYYLVEDVEDLGGGRTRIRMPYSDHEWMVRLLLRLGDQVRIEQPVELAQAVRHRAELALLRARHQPAD